MGTCASCRGPVYQLLDGIDACRRCGVRTNEQRFLADILREVEAFLRRYVVFGSDGQIVAVTLHAAHTHAVDAADATGYLHVRSAEKRSGKSRLLEALELIVRRPVRSTTISPAALYRLLDSECRTLLLDEVDSIFSPKADREELRGLLNAGYRRGSLAYRIEIRGKEMIPRAFDAFGAKILAGIGNVPDTIADRCIPIELHRRRRDESVEPFRYRDAAGQGEKILRRLEEWVRIPGTLAALRAARPKLPDLEDDRALEAWEPLVAIADAAGGDWPTRARAAVVDLHSERNANEGTGVLTLAAIRELFADRDRISTDELLHGLAARDDGPWAYWWADELERADRDGRPPLKAMRSLRRELERYRIKLPSAGTIRLEDGSTRKGYYRQAFEDVWARYVPAISVTSGTTVTPQVDPLRFEEGNRHTVTNRNALTSDVTDVSDVSVLEASREEEDTRPNGHRPADDDEEAAFRILQTALGAFDSATLDFIVQRHTEGADFTRITGELNRDGFAPPPGRAGWDLSQTVIAYGVRRP